MTERFLKRPREILPVLLSGCSVSGQSDETGELGTTTLVFDLSSQSVSGTVASDFKIIIDNDTDFSTGATLVSASSYVGGIATFTGVNLDDGQFFALGTAENNLPIADAGGPYTINEGDGSPECQRFRRYRWHDRGIRMGPGQRWGI